MSKQNEPNVYMYSKKEPISKTQNFLRFLFNKETGQILGRTPKSWAQIGIFYLVFYLCLAALFTLCIWVFFQTLDPREPKWKLDESLIGTNPGLGFRPMPADGNVESTLIWYKGYKGKNHEDYKYWTDELQKFLEVYKTPGLIPGRGQNIYNCDYDRPPGEGQVCDVQIRKFQPCSEENHFNYHKGSPCIFLKLNKIFGWEPEYYNTTHDLPEEMPEVLKNHIKSLIASGSKKLKTVWVTCEGENPADVENLGRIKYIPEPGFPYYYFPYKNYEGYLSPLVAIQIENPTPGIIINIECKAWAKNIKHSRADRLGSVHLELMID